MSIKIQNIGGNVLGESRYEITINGKHIAFFKHNRPAGLGICLEQAANAAHRVKLKEVAEQLLKKEGL